MWLREVMYAIKRDLIGLIGLIGRLSDKKGLAKNQGPYSNDKKVLSKQTGRYCGIHKPRDNVCKGPPRVHCLKERLHARNQRPILKDKKVISLFKTGGQTWLIEGLYAIKRDVLRFIGSKESCMQKMKVLT